MAARSKNRKNLKRQLLLYPWANFIQTSWECCLASGPINKVAIRAISTMTTLNSGEQFRAILALLFQNNIKYDNVACNSNSNAYKNQQIFASRGIVRGPTSLASLNNVHVVLSV